MVFNFDNSRGNMLLNRILAATESRIAQEESTQDGRILIDPCQLCERATNGCPVYPCDQRVAYENKTTYENVHYPKRCETCHCVLINCRCKKDK